MRLVACWAARSVSSYAAATMTCSAGELGEFGCEDRETLTLPFSRTERDGEVVALDIPQRLQALFKGL